MKNKEQNSASYPKILQVAYAPAGVIEMPASKSEIHRALICAALAAGGQSVISNTRGMGRDAEATLNALENLGALCSREENSLKISAAARLRQGASIDCAESGSTLRFALPLMLLGGGGTIKGAPRLWQRPWRVFAEALTEKGGAFKLEGNILTISGVLKAGLYQLPGNISSQFVSALLMALPVLPNDSVIALSTPLESLDYVKLTLQVMKRFGVTAESSDYRQFRVPGAQRYKPGEYILEGDYSAAAFFLAAAALGCEVVCGGLKEDSLQGDRRILEILEQCGAAIIRKNGGITAKAAALRGAEVDCRHIPDLVPPLCAMLIFAEGRSRLYGARRLRLKESDRLKTLSAQLSALGAKIEETADGLLIEGVARLKGGRVNPANDHRIAMAAALAALKSEGAVEIIDPQCVDKSYPFFWRDFLKKPLAE
jgi:3-phosphoshikimate 1-carboxyvinyltransferase